MKLKRTGSRKLKLGAAVMLLLAVAGGAYFGFAQQNPVEPVEISNAEELQQIRDDLDGDYVLVDDVNLSHIDNFKPIGEANNPFTGTFRGNGHTISNLTIHRPNEWEVGLFGSIESESGGPYFQIRNVSLEDVNVTGESVVGGLVGINEESGVRGSYVTGVVDGNYAVGGIVGLADGVIADSYAESNVSGNDSVGGIVGHNNGEVVRSYSVSEVTGYVRVGGLVGQEGLGDVRNSYWDVNSTGQETSAGGTGLTTSEMTGINARKNMEGFDFGETWRTTENDYPRLAWQDAEDYNPRPDEPREDISTSQTRTQSEDSTSTDLVSFSGLIFKNRTVRSLQWFYLENRTDTTNPDGDDFTMQGIDADGNVISSQSFDAPFRAYVSPSEESPIETDVTTFVLKEKYPSDLAKFRLVEDGKTVAEFNPNVGLLRTSAESIPRTGFKQQEVAERRRKTLLNEIDALENTIEDGNMEEAVRKMENEIKPSLDRWLEDGYETKSALQLTKDEVLTTAEAVTKRLKAQRRSRR